MADRVYDALDFETQGSGVSVQTSSHAQSLQRREIKSSPRLRGAADEGFGISQARFLRSSGRGGFGNPVSMLLVSESHATHSIRIAAIARSFLNPHMCNSGNAMASRGTCIANRPYLKRTAPGWEYMCCTKPPLPLYSFAMIVILFHT
jgi:hypothetical protein